MCLVTLKCEGWTVCARPRFGWLKGRIGRRLQSDRQMREAKRSIDRRKERMGSEMGCMENYIKLYQDSRGQARGNGRPDGSSITLLPLHGCAAGHLHLHPHLHRRHSLYSDRSPSLDPIRPPHPPHRVHSNRR